MDYKTSLMIIGGILALSITGAVGAEAVRPDTCSMDNEIMDIVPELNDCIPPERPLTVEFSSNVDNIYAVESGEECTETNSISTTNSVTQQTSMDIDSANKRDFKFCQEDTGTVYESSVYSFSDFDFGDGETMTIDLQSDSGNQKSVIVEEWNTVVY